MDLLSLGSGLTGSWMDFSMEKELVSNLDPRFLHWNGNNINQIFMHRCIGSSVRSQYMCGQIYLAQKYSCMSRYVHMYLHGKLLESFTYFNNSIDGCIFSFSISFFLSGLERTDFSRLGLRLFVLYSRAATITGIYLNL